MAPSASMVRGEIEWEFSEDADGGGSFMATNKAITFIRQHLTRGEVDIALSLYESCAEDVGDELLLELDMASSSLQKALANLFYRSRDYARAALTCVRLEQWAQAAKAFQAAGDYANAADAYLKNNQLTEAAANFEKAGMSEKAIEIHRRNQDFDSAARVAAATGQPLAAARMWTDTGNRIAASRVLSAVSLAHPQYEEASELLRELNPGRSATVVDGNDGNMATEPLAPAYTGKLSVDDPFSALSGNVFEQKAPQKRAASISNIDEFSHQAASRFVTKMEGYDSLKQLPIFEGLSLDEMKDVYHLGAHVDYAPGSVLIEQGRAGEALFIIRKGAVQVCVLSDGEEQVVAEMSDGSFVGEMSLIDESPTSARVVAKELTRVFVLRSDVLGNYLYRNDQAALKIYKSFAKTLASRLRDATQKAAR